MSKVSESRGSRLEPSGPGHITVKTGVFSWIAVEQGTSREGDREGGGGAGASQGTRSIGWGLRLVRIITL